MLLGGLESIAQSLDLLHDIIWVYILDHVQVWLCQILHLVQGVHASDLLETLLHKRVVEVLLYLVEAGLCIVDHLHGVVKVNFLESLQVQTWQWWHLHVLELLGHPLNMLSSLIKIEPTHALVHVGHPELLLSDVLLHIEQTVNIRWLHLIVKSQHCESVLDPHGRVLGLQTQAPLDIWEWNHGESLPKDSVGHHLQSFVLLGQVLHVHDLVVQVSSLIELLAAVGIKDLELLHVGSEVLEDTEDKRNAIGHLDLLVHWVCHVVEQVGASEALHGHHWFEDFGAVREIKLSLSLERYEEFTVLTPLWIVLLRHHVGEELHELLDL